mgnify:FL=1
MSYGQNKIGSEQRSPILYRDLDLFFGRKTNSKDISMVTDINAVKRSVRNLILIS